MANEGVFFDPSTLYNFFGAQNGLPVWVKDVPNSSANAYYNRSTNALVARAPNDRYYWRNELAHEMTHAALNRMATTADVIQANAREGKAPTTVEQRFLDAYRKIYSSPPQTMGQYQRSVEEPAAAMRDKTITALAGNRFDIEGPRYKSYRTSPSEALAHGVGGMTQRNNDAVALHLDSTMATEFSILKALHGQLPESVQAQSALEWNKAFKNAKLPPEATPSNTFYTYPDPFLSKK